MLLVFAALELRSGWSAVSGSATVVVDEVFAGSALLPNMLVGQIYGEGNPVADAVSRGWWKLIAAYERQLGVKLVWITPSARSLAFLNDVRNAYTRRLSAVESSRSTAHSNCDAGDGPSSIGSPLDTPPRPAARRGVSHHLAATPPATAPPRELASAASGRCVTIS